MKPFLVLLLLALLVPPTAHAQDRHAAERRIEFPDIPGYQTLKCDLHLHTVFSDGSVWPQRRGLFVAQGLKNEKLRRSDLSERLSLGFS